MQIRSINTHLELLHLQVEVGLLKCLCEALSDWGLLFHNVVSVLSVLCRIA